jgi:ABC-type branched-subunit amino acid transport system substrate-binding protein
MKLITACTSLRRLLQLSLLSAGVLSSSVYAQQPIVIGQSAPLSGVLADTGKEMVLGGRIYFDHINSKGGINGRKIQHVVLDDGYEVSRTVSNTRELLDKHGAVALFGYAGTGNIQRLLEDKVLADAGVAMVGPYTGGESLRTPYNRYIFHIRAGYAEETATMVKMLTGSGITRLGVMYQDDAFGKAGLQGVVDALKPLNLEPVVSASYPKNTDDVQAAVQAIAAKQPQAVILISVNKSSAAFLTAYRKIDPASLLFNVSVVNPKAIAAIAGSVDTRGFSIAQVVPNPLSEAFSAAREYRTLLARYGHGAEPSYTSFEEFLAAKTLVEGLQRAKSPTREAIIAALESLERLDLGGYTVSFGPNNRRGSKWVELVTIRKDGKVVY